MEDGLELGLKDAGADDRCVRFLAANKISCETLSKSMRISRRAGNAHFRS
jgi:hypothetical protein